MRALVLSATFILPFVSAYNTHYVTVGGPGKLLYTPEWVAAAVGDHVRFTFQQKNHTATQSSFDEPCKKWPGGFDSGFFPVPDGQMDNFPYWDLEVKVHTPIWVYCRQTAHCTQGMVFAVNPPDTGNTFQDFKWKAKGIADGSGTSSGYPAPTEHHIVVGGIAGNVYTPNWIDAKKGDNVIFEFKQKNHTVTQSSFDNPCRKLEFTSQTGEKGFDSDFKPVPPEQAGDFPKWTYTVPDDTKPIWAYCRQTGHCGQGMVFAINPSKGGKSFDDFKHNAIRLNGTRIDPAAPNPGASAPTPGENPTHLWVTVGGEAGNIYKPHSVVAKKGDTITFEFKQKNHTVTQSSYDFPCRKLEHSTGEKGFDSGFIPVPPEQTSNFPTWTYTVSDDTKPIWAYCQQGNHCEQGMVFAINPTKGGDEYEDFLENAINPDEDSPDDDDGPDYDSGTAKAVVGSSSGYVFEGLSGDGVKALLHFAGAFIEL